MAPAACVASACYGSIFDGRLEDGRQLPARGSNYQAYSQLGVTLGRTWLHADVHGAVTQAYAALERAAPGKTFVYGETAFAGGGRIRPHRTHQTGTSADFMVPVVDRAGKSIPLPASVANKFGYAIEFDAEGKADGVRIDFEAMAEHLHQLSVAARSNGSGIERVIFDPALMPHLFRTARGRELQQTLSFMKTRPWIRHDEHYHVDFAVRCRPLGKRRQAGIHNPFAYRRHCAKPPMYHAQYGFPPSRERRRS
jgi:penicillin-insensitive murein endopeptidase